MTETSPLLGGAKPPKPAAGLKVLVLDPQPESRALLKAALRSINSIESVTLTANAAETTLTDRRIGPDSFIGWMPTTLNAARALHGLLVTSRGKQTATISHENNSLADRTFQYVVLG